MAAKIPPRHPEPGGRLLIDRARRMRSEPTRSVRLLWQQLRNSKLGCRFRRQSPFATYILDFVAPSARLVIELDGETHEDGALQADEIRDAILAAAGFRTLRFTNTEVTDNLDGVVDEIRAHLERSAGA